MFKSCRGRLLFLSDPPFGPIDCGDAPLAPFPAHSPAVVGQAFGPPPGPFMKGVNRSIGTGRKVVVLCSLEISRMVWRNRNWRAMGSLLIIAAAWTIFSAA